MLLLVANCLLLVPVVSGCGLCEMGMTQDHFGQQIQQQLLLMRHQLLQQMHQQITIMYQQHMSHKMMGYNNELKATCNLQADPKSSQNVSGIIHFSQIPGHVIKIEAFITGLGPVAKGSPEQSFLHGFHVHEKGDVSGGCGSAGGHYNPRGVEHGGPVAGVRHAGDFGNIKQSPSGVSNVTFTDNLATLFGDESIIGRALVLHAGADDLGRVGNAGSKASGNAGPRLGCCVIEKVENKVDVLKILGYNRQPSSDCVNKCAHKGKLGERFLQNLNFNDQNRDGFTTGDEFFIDFRDNYDVNKDGCCSLEEWTNRWQGFYEFSREFAVKRFAEIVPDINVNCPIKYSTYLDPPVVKLTVDQFLDGNIKSLVGFCDSNELLMSTNCDCIQLLEACSTDKLMSKQQACTEYIKIRHRS